MPQAVALNGTRVGGSNPEARLARALQMMTFRPLFITLPPDEDWVALRYLDGTKERELLFDWLVWDQTSIAAAAASHTLRSMEIDPYTLKSPGARLLGIDFAAHAIKDAQQALVKKSLRAKRTQVVAADPSEIVSELPQYFKATSVDTPAGTFAYIKISQFNIQDAGVFSQEFMRLLSL